ncbi:MAG TPA: TraB/GumN family protein [Methanocellales archaeon]|nr:TraB/GumN family protein [Methanocellales archaeon]
MNPDIIIIGTAHVSDKSIEEVRSTIDREKPNVVAVELCPRRYKALKGEMQTEPLIKDVLNGGYLLLVQWLLAWIQTKIASEKGVEPGAEMKSAIEIAEKTGASIALIDRDIGITLRRFWSRMTFFERIRMFFALISASFGERKEIDMETITEEDVVTQLVSELRSFSPSAAKVLVDERDAYIAGNLLNAAKGGKVVAVIGAGHRKGVENFLAHPELIPPFEELVHIPKKLNVMKFLGVLVMLSILMTFVLLVMSVPLEKLLVALGYWFIITGTLSGLGALLAGAHPLSIATAFGVAWLTTLHPFLAAGWFAGLAEAYVRKPTSNDFKRMMGAETLDDLRKNRLFRVILVAALANIGSAIGTFVSIFVVLHMTGIDPRAILEHAFSIIIG